MKKFFCMGVCALLLVSAVAFADVVEKVVFEIDGFGITSAFTSNGTIQNCGTLNWTKGSAAFVYTTGNPTPTRYYPTVSATFNNGTDTSAGNLASAVFSNLNFTVNLYTDYARNYLMGTIVGTLYGSYNYVEKEILEGTVLNGAGVVKVTQFNCGIYTWLEGLNQPTGLRSETSLSSSLSNYQSNWSSNNTKITILADESGIPEPATIGLLSLGGLLLRRKK